MSAAPWQRQDGRWTGAAYVLSTGGAFKRTYVYGRTREAVHDRLVKLQDLSARGIPQPSRAWKVGECRVAALTAEPVIPVTYDRYPGTSGRQRGDRNVTAPAAAATGIASSTGPEATS